MGPTLAFENLTLGYDRHPAVHHLDAVIHGGSLTAIVGPNGAGKSTLVKGIVGELAPLEGRIQIENMVSGNIAYLPQQTDMDRSFPISVRDMVTMGLWRQAGAFGTVGKRGATRVRDALAAVGLTGFERRQIGSLSGGQFQRMLFARLLLQDAPLIVLDEPFSAIDVKTAADLLAIIRRWHSEEKTIIAVLHDFDHVRNHFPKTVLIARELIALGDTSSVMTESNLLRARQMSEAFDDTAEICDRPSRGWAA